MNWLAHLALARHSDAALRGAMLGDFALGASGLERFGPVEHAEILLHRRIDRFTDAHPLVADVRALFGDGRRRFAGIALDVYFDHLLARDWSRWQAELAHLPPLQAFTARAYAALDAGFETLPPRLQALLPAMRAGDWLAGYRHRANVDRTVERIATRLSRHGDRLIDCLEDLRRHEHAIDDAFEAFFPLLVAFVDGTRGHD